MGAALVNSILLLEFWDKRFAIMLGSCFVILGGCFELVWIYLRVGLWFAVWPKRFLSGVECGI